MSGSNGFIVKRSNKNKYEFIKSKDLKLTIYVPELGVKAFIKFDNFHDMLGVSFEIVPYYRGITCSPRTTYEQHLNIWEDNISVTNTTDFDLEYLSTFLSYLQDIICNGNKENYKFLLGWFKRCILQPEIKTGIILVLQTDDKGTGKYTLPEFIAEFCIGSNKSLLTTGIDSITSKFNQHMIGKVFVNVDELQSGGTQFHNNFDKLKNYTTHNEIYIEGKGTNGCQVENLLNFIFTLNWRDGIKIEEGDRRYFVMEPSNKMSAIIETDPILRLEKLKYWEHLHSFLHGKNGIETARQFTNYLKTTEDVNLRDPPITEIKSQMIDNSKDSTIEFMEAFINRECNFEEQFLKNPNRLERIEDNNFTGDSIIVSRDSLYSSYLNFCCSAGIKSRSRKQLYDCCRNKFKIEDTRVKINKQAIRLLKIELAEEED